MRKPTHTAGEDAKRNARRRKLTIGRSEYLSLPEWGIAKILAKIDTGAKTSALHVENLIRLPGGKVEFLVIANRTSKHGRRRIIADAVRWARVRSSSGEYTVRCFVRTLAQLGPVTKEIEISLDNRDKMNYRMLIGRAALKGDFLVDVSKQHAFRKLGHTRNA